MEGNLIVTFEPAHRGSAEGEIKAILESIGETVEIVETHEGLFVLNVNNPKDVVKSIKNICLKEPDKFQYTYRWIPVEKWVSLDIEEMQNVIKEFVPQIGEEERWKMEFEKRNWNVDFKETIIKLTDPVDRKHVDLTNPEKIISVQVVGNKAGISLLTSDEYFSVSKTKS